MSSYGASGMVGSSSASSARDPGGRRGVAAFRDRRERLLDERRLARVDLLRARRLGLLLVRHVEREHVAVGLEELRFARRVADVAVVIERRAQDLGHHLLDPAARRIVPERLPVRLDHRRGGLEPGEPGILVGKRPALEAQRMELAPELGGVLVGHRLHERLREELVGALVEVGNRLDRLERLLVHALVGAGARDDLLEPCARGTARRTSACRRHPSSRGSPWRTARAAAPRSTSAPRRSARAPFSPRRRTRRCRGVRCSCGGGRR